MSVLVCVSVGKSLGVSVGLAVGKTAGIPVGAVVGVVVGVSVEPQRTKFGGQMVVSGRNEKQKLNSFLHGPLLSSTHEVH